VSAQCCTTSRRLTSWRKNILSSGGSAGRRPKAGPRRPDPSAGRPASPVAQGDHPRYRSRSIISGPLLPLVPERDFDHIVPLREVHRLVRRQAFFVEEVVDRPVGVGEGVVHETERVPESSRGSAAWCASIACARSRAAAGGRDPRAPPRSRPDACRCGGTPADLRRGCVDPAPRPEIDRVVPGPQGRVRQPVVGASRRPAGAGAALPRIAPQLRAAVGTMVIGPAIRRLSQREGTPATGFIAGGESAKGWVGR